MHICAGLSESLSHVVMKLCPSTVFQLSRFTTSIAGRKSRERELERKRLHGACTQFFCFGLVS